MAKCQAKVALFVFVFIIITYAPLEWNVKELFSDTGEERKAPVIPDRASQQLSGNYLLPAGINVATGLQESYRENDGWHNWLGGDNDKKWHLFKWNSRELIRNNNNFVSGRLESSIVIFVFYLRLL